MVVLAESSLGAAVDEVPVGDELSGTPSVEVDSTLVAESNIEHLLGRHVYWSARAEELQVAQTVAQREVAIAATISRVLPGQLMMFGEEPRWPLKKS